jgi:DNA-binding IclR family transcriptional regulator
MPMACELHIEGYNSLAPDEKGAVLQTVQRALRVLSLIAEHPQGLTVRQISKALELNTSTCYHLLNTLVVNGYLDRLPHQQIYLLDPQIPFLNNSLFVNIR